MSIMATCFPSTTTPEGYCNNPGYYRSCHSSFSNIVPYELARQVTAYRSPRAGDVNYMFYTKPGPGPISLTDESLLGLDGQPIPPGPKHRRLVIRSSNAAAPNADAEGSTFIDILSQPGKFLSNGSNLALCVVPIVGALALKYFAHCKCKGK